MTSVSRDRSRVQRETDLNAALQTASQRPELRALEAAIQEAEAELRLGLSFSKPEYGVGVRYSREEGDQIVLGGMTVTLPMFSKGQEQRAVGSARAARLRAELDAARTRVQLEVRAAFDAYNRRLAAVRVLEAEAIPGLDENEQLTTRSFEVGQLGLPELLLDPPGNPRHPLSISGRSSGGCVGPDRSGCQRRNTAMTVKTFVICSSRASRSSPAAAAPRRPRSRQRRNPNAAEADAHKEDANTVEVDEGMLRDLRITTRAVESRAGGELVMLLGELAVDQRAYAEVGAPVAARVTRLLVNAGDAVRSGQTLAELTSPELGRERAEYLSASARLKLAEAALERKRGLAAEKIVPLREVQEAESAAGEARAALRASRAAIAAFGVEPPADDGDGATSSAFVLAFAGRRDR